jgi:hypothetical protein
MCGWTEKRTGMKCEHTLEYAMDEPITYFCGTIFCMEEKKCGTIINWPFSHDNTTPSPPNF